jgi:hypothetical protein
MAPRKSALPAGDESAVSEVVPVIDDIGPAWIVDGVRHPTTADRLEYVGRLALAQAASLRGEIDPKESPDVDPFRPIWPRRLPFELGIPPEFYVEARLSGCQRFVWVALWGLVPHVTGRLVVRERLSWVAQWLSLDPETVRRALRRFHELGWATVLWRASKPSGYGEFEALLHLTPRVDALGAAIETTAAEPSNGER